MISFIVAGMFWFSHHRRLALSPEGSRGEVFLNVIFLLSIIILPVTNGLYGVFRLDGVVAVIYGIHLTTIATLNALLWILALRGHGDRALLAIIDLPRRCIRPGDNRRLLRPACRSIHLVPGIPLAAGGLAGSPAPRKSAIDPRARAA